MLCMLVIKRLVVLETLHKKYFAVTGAVLAGLVGLSLVSSSFARVISDVEVFLSNHLLPVAILLGLMAADETFKFKALGAATKVLSRGSKEMGHDAWRNVYRVSLHFTALRWSFTTAMLVAAAISVWHKLKVGHEIEPVLTGLYGIFFIVTTFVPVSSGADARTRLFKIDAHLSRQFNERQSLGKALAELDQIINTRRTRSKKH